MSTPIWPQGRDGADREDRELKRRLDKRTRRLVYARSDQERLDCSAYDCPDDEKREKGKCSDLEVWNNRGDTLDEFLGVEHFKKSVDYGLHRYSTQYA